MNISEVDMLSDNLRMLYHGMSYPILLILIGGHAWYLTDDKITKRSFSYTPQQLSEDLFYWL